MGEQQRKMQGDLEMREQQVQELQKSRNEMYEKLMEAENSRGRHDEARLHKELAQLQVLRMGAASYVVGLYISLFDSDP